MGSELGGLTPKKHNDLDLEEPLVHKLSNLLPVLKYREGDPMGTEETRSPNPPGMRSIQFEHSATVAKGAPLLASPQESPIHRQGSPSGPAFPELTSNLTREQPTANLALAEGNTLISLMSKFTPQLPPGPRTVHDPVKWLGRADRVQAGTAGDSGALGRGVGEIGGNGRDRDSETAAV